MVTTALQNKQLACHDFNITYYIFEITPNKYMHGRTFKDFGDQLNKQDEAILPNFPAQDKNSVAKLPNGFNIVISFSPFISY
jgi:hypothetical protein